MKKLFVGLLVTMLIACAGIFSGLNVQSKEDPENRKSPVVTVPDIDGPIA